MSSINPPMFATFGHETVTIVHAEGTAEENRFQVEAHINPKHGCVAYDTPVYEGDIVEIKDPRGGIDRRYVEKVNIYKPNGNRMSHMCFSELIWGNAPRTRIAPVRRVTIENLHSCVIETSGELFADGHLDAAVSEAFKSIEVRVRDLIKSKQSGVKLMAEAFQGETPKLILSTIGGQSGKDEQDGFFTLFRGAMLGIRNPHAHELAREMNPQVAIEYLALASLLHRRLDLNS